MAEFVANNAVNVSTGFTPFFLNGGSHPTVPGTLLERPRQTPIEAVNKMVDRMKVALEQAQVNLAAAQKRMKQQVDKHRRVKELQVGDEVVLSTRHLQGGVCAHLPAKL